MNLKESILKSRSGAIKKQPKPKSKFTKLAESNRYILLSVCASLLIFLIIAISYKMKPFGDITILRMDLYHQYGPLLAELYDRLTSGDLSVIYSFESGGGGNFLGNFYNYLSSPISILAILIFGHLNMPLAIYFIIIAKISLSAGTFTYYLKKSPQFKKHNYITAGFGILYAFSGYFVAYYWNIMWLEGMLLLPLCVLGLEYLIEYKKCWLYCLSFALLLVCSYYMAYMTAIFLVLYFLVYIFGKSKFSSKEFAQALGRAVLYAVVAGLLAAFSLLPTYFALKSCSATSGTFPTELSTYFTFFDFIANHMADVEPTIRSSGDTVLPNVFCGVGTVLLAVMFFYMKSIPLREKAAKLIMLIILYASFNINYLNYIWHGFHFPNDLPYRQSFVYVFFLLTISFKALIKIRELEAKHIISIGIVTILFAAVIEKVGQVNVTQDSVVITAAFAIIYTFVLAALSSPKAKVRSLAAAMFCIMFAEMTISDISNFDIDVTYTSYTAEYQEVQDAKELIESREDTEAYRMETTYSMLCMNPSWYGYNGISCFSSMAYEKTSNLHHDLGIAGNYINSYTYYLNTPIYNAMFSLKYLIDNDNTEMPDALFTPIGYTGTMTVYENNYCLPIAYSVNKSVIDWSYDNQNPFTNQNNYIKCATNADSDVLEPISMNTVYTDNLVDTTDELSNGTCTFTKSVTGNDGSATFEFTVPSTQEIYIYVETASADTMVIRSEDGSLYREETVSTDNQHVVDLGLQQEGTTLYIDVPVSASDDTAVIEVYAAGLNQEVWDYDYALLNDSGVMNINEFSDTYISGEVTVSSDEMLYTSINYDDGWTITVDGTEVGPESIYKLGGALIGIELEEGTHTVEFKYSSAGLREGLIISGVTCLAIIAVNVWKKRWAPKKEMPETTSSI